MTKTVNDTPRTDDQEKPADNYHPDTYVVTSDFAKGLEMVNNRLKAALNIAVNTLLFKDNYEISPNGIDKALHDIRDIIETES